MHLLASEFYRRVEETLQGQSAMYRMSAWLERHTAIHGAPFSFKDHEFQVQIVDDTHQDIAVRKPSQVGLSELMARMVLAFLAAQRGAVAILSLPTVHEAQRFAKSRIDPVIAGSEYLRGSVPAGNDSASFKSVGNGQLFTVGTFGKAIISVPADLLVCDEVDFSNQETLVTAESRLSHSRFIDEATGVRGYRRFFSTPTVPDFGISAAFDVSDQHFRMVKCTHCSHWFWPSFLQHVVVDGWDRPMEEMAWQDVEALELAGTTDTGRLLCEVCHCPVDLSADNRSWVAAHPGRQRRGYAVSPFDLPAYNTVPTLLRRLMKYRDEVGHFRNFGLGLPHSDATNTVLMSRVDENTVLDPIAPEVARASGVRGCVAGLDLGKVSWLAVGKPIPESGKMHVLWFERIRLRDLSALTDETGRSLKERLLHVLSCYGVVQFCLDALPYTDTVADILAARPVGMVHPVSYTLHDRKVASHILSEKDQAVAAHRTKTLDVSVRRINTGKVQFPKLDEMGVVKKHLGGMKRIEREVDGEIDASWVSTSEDHYFHALNYLMIAWDMYQTSYGFGVVAPVTITQARVGAQFEKNQRKTLVGIA